MIKHFLFYSVKWLSIATLVGLLTGSVSAFFLVALDFVTDLREKAPAIIVLLPIAGLLIGLLYYYFGKDIEAGSKKLMATVANPKNTIPFKMAPFVLVSTLITHLFGGSAGREGTAVQIGGTIADQLVNIFRLTPTERKLLIVSGISAGFGAVFGTPMAGAIFALEVFFRNQLHYKALLPVFAASISADIVTQQIWEVHHTQYHLAMVPDISITGVCYALLAGVIFGITARMFYNITAFIGYCFQPLKYPPLRPLVGGCLVAASVYAIGSTRYVGLGIPVIAGAFNEQLPYYDFLFKLLFTALTLGAGFKGGEVTPLFFIGATLGSALSFIIPLPVSLLAGMGFVSVFAAAANAPLTCILMAIELFGSGCGIYMALTCMVAFWVSGKSSIYKAL